MRVSTGHVNRGHEGYPKWALHTPLPLPLPKISLTHITLHHIPLPRSLTLQGMAEGYVKWASRAGAKFGKGKHEEQVGPRGLH